MAQQTQRALRKAKKVHQAKKKSYEQAQGATTRARLGSTAGAGLGTLARKVKASRKPPPRR